MPVNDELRINATTGKSLEATVLVLAGGNPGATIVLMEWIRVDPMAMLGFFHLDIVHLYENSIWDVYEPCGSNIDRFIYHVSMELPNQATGVHGMFGPYVNQIDLVSFAAKRKFGRPGSFWALEHPPIERDYAYPIG